MANFSPPDLHVTSGEITLVASTKDNVNAMLGLGRGFEIAFGVHFAGKFLFVSEAHWGGKVAWSFWRGNLAQTAIFNFVRWSEDAKLHIFGITQGDSCKTAAPSSFHAQKRPSSSGQRRGEKDSKTDRNVTPKLVFRVLYKIVDLLKSYFGGATSAKAAASAAAGAVAPNAKTGLLESHVHRHFALIYELLDEIIDFGYPQILEADILRKYITRGSGVTLRLVVVSTLPRIWPAQSEAILEGTRRWAGSLDRTPLRVMSKMSNFEPSDQGTKLGMLVCCKLLL